MNRSAWLGDATGVGHLPHHVSGVAGLRRPGLEIRLPLDAEENSKWVCVCLCLVFLKTQPVRLSLLQQRTAETICLLFLASAWVLKATKGFSLNFLLRKQLQR